MNQELPRYGTLLFAEKVQRKLPPLASEREHRWGPRLMETAQRAAVPAFLAVE
jgi:hypothetical protein